MRDHLPRGAQTIYRKSFNNAWKQYEDAGNRRGSATREETAHRVAWAAVKKSYKKKIVLAMHAALARSSDTREPSAGLRELYERLPEVDFSRPVLEQATDRLRVRPVSHCGWTDLGTVRRVSRTVRSLPPSRAAAAVDEAFFDLATALGLRVPGNQPYNLGNPDRCKEIVELLKHHGAKE